MADRLTETELAWLERNVDMVSSVSLTRRAIAELKARRQADLSAAERDALKWARACAIAADLFEEHEPDRERALAVLDRLIRGAP